RFTTPGSHLISLRISDDALPGDNRQDFAVEVVDALPVLLIDGDERPSPKVRGTDFLRDALAPARDPNPAIFVRVMPINGFDAVHLTQDLGDQPGTAPRVLVLSNVPRLTPAQQEGVENFLAQGGGGRGGGRRGTRTTRFSGGGGAGCRHRSSSRSAPRMTRRRPLGPSRRASSTPRSNSSAKWASAGSPMRVSRGAGRYRSPARAC